MRLDDSEKRGILGEVALALLPELIKEAVIEDPAVLQAFQLTRKSNGTVAFADSPKFLTSVISWAVTEASDTNSHVHIRDLAGAEWSVLIEVDDSGIRIAKVTSEHQHFDYMHAGVLMTDVSTRLASFTRMADGALLPEEDRCRWKEVLVDRPLTNIELEDLHEDVENTPLKFAMRLRDELRRGQMSSDALLPHSAAYYERLIGKLGEAITVQEHAEQGALRWVQELLARDARDGLLLSLPLAVHSSLSSSIQLLELKPEIVLSVFKFLQNGDLVSKIGAIEAAIPLLDMRPEFLSPVADLVDSIQDCDPDTSEGDFFALSRLFIFVDSELSRLGVLRGRPPFYRRLAAFAHASIIQRQLKLSNSDTSGFFRWIDAHCIVQFYSQSLVDLRAEPRWHPDLAHAAQLKQEFIGRLLAIGESQRSIIEGSRLGDLLLHTSDHQSSLKRLVEFPKPYLPGPLEGYADQAQPMPEDFRNVIDKQLENPSSSAESFIAAINMSGIFLLEPELAERIAEILKEGKYFLHKIQDDIELDAILAGLAKVAAVTRSQVLAQDVRVLVRKYRRELGLKVSISGAYRTLLFAAAAYSDLSEWRRFVSVAMEDLAFGPLSKGECSQLQAHLNSLFVAEPELWILLGGTDAALSALSFS